MFSLYRTAFLVFYHNTESYGVTHIIKESYKKDILILLHEYQGKLPLARIGLPSTDRETLETILQNA